MRHPSREGKLYRVIDTQSDTFVKGSIVVMTDDDGSEVPRFRLVLGAIKNDWERHHDEWDGLWTAITDVEPLENLP